VEIKKTRMNEEVKKINKEELFKTKKKLSIIER
jgi:hypothetical protein